MKQWIVAAALLALAGGARAEAPGEESAMEQSADMLLVGIPAVALGLTFLLNVDEPGDGKILGFDAISLNGKPRHDLGLTMARTVGITYGLKFVVDEERPNGEDHSFPSGHTAVTFAGAEFIRKQYGWGWGTPAYVAASFVGWSRVETDDHWWHDVAAGAAIGILSNYNLSDLRTPWGGVSIAPAMLRAHPVALNPAEVPTTGAGLKMELRF